jgi:uncharacterized protein YndB with AHSA1/START domain
MTTTDQTAVRKSITVKAPVEHAFRVYTEGNDTWWPRTHHIGKVAMTKSTIDGSECDWGKVLVWDPPRRFVMAWLINANWQYEPDISKTSEVEVIFTPEADGSTRVDLEHRHFERMGEAGEKMRAGVDGPGAWGDMLVLFQKRAEETK